MRDRFVRRTSRSMRWALVTHQGRIRDLDRGRLSAGDGVLRMRPRGEAHRRSDLSGRARLHALQHLQHRRVWRPHPRPADALLSPYSTDSEHLWNRLHRALFVRTAKNGAQYVHSVDPFLYENGSFLLEGDAHRGAITVLDEFLAAPREQMVDDPRERL